MSFLSIGKVKSAALQSISGSTLPIAIDFGVSALKMLQLQAGEPPSLIAAASLETPDSLLNDHPKRLQFQMQALPRLLKAGRFKGKRAACAIPSSHMFCKHMQFPRSNDVSVADMVRAAVPEILEVPLDALVLRHFVVDGALAAGTGSQGSGGSKQEVICMAASRELVSRLMGSIRDARLEPVGIQPEPVITIKAFEHINRRAADAHLATLYLDLACGTTKAWITHGSSLVFAKTIQMGGCQLDTAVAKALDLKMSDARAKRLAASVLVAPARTVPGGIATGAGIVPSSGNPAPGSAPDGTQTQAERQAAIAVAEERRRGQIATGLTPPVTQQEIATVAPPEFDLNEPLEALTDEIAMCLRYYETMFPGRRVDRAVFFGGEARHRGLCQHIARRIRLAAQVADPLARMARTGKEPVLGVDFQTPQPGWTIPFGLSLCPADF